MSRALLFALSHDLKFLQRSTSPFLLLLFSSSFSARHNEHIGSQSSMMKYFKPPRLGVDVPNHHTYLVYTRKEQPNPSLLVFSFFLLPHTKLQPAIISVVSNDSLRKVMDLDDAALLEPQRHSRFNLLVGGHVEAHAAACFS